MTRLAGGPAPTRADLDAADRVRELQATELERVRERASGWRDALIGITAVFGAVVFVKGGASVAALTPWARWTVVAAIGLALIAVVAAAVLATAAAFGSMAPPSPVGPALGLHERLLAEDRRRVRQAVTRLRRAAALTILGVAAMAVAAGVGMVGPQQPKKAGGTCVVLGGPGGVTATVSASGGQPVKVTGPSLEARPC